MTSDLNEKEKQALFEFLLRLGDDRLILGHRLSEWCGHAPILEEDIALANISLDLIGQATLLFNSAGQIEGKGRSEDDLAYLREAREFKNIALVEQPRGDFATTIVRQFLFDTHAYYLLEILKSTPVSQLRGIAEKAYKETSYHLRHSSEWLLRLGDGTKESHEKAANALENLWMFTGELFYTDEVDEILKTKGILGDTNPIQAKWEKHVKEVLTAATLSVPSADSYMYSKSRKGFHTEHLGHLLAEMQIVPRSFPGATW